MKGDFSNWRFDPHDNDQGVLFQQGRVMRDVDLTAGELIALNWKGQVGRDVIGRGVAAVSSAEPDSFKVVSAAVVGDTTPEVHLQIQPGRLWADGLLVYLPEGSGGPGVPVDRIAEYFTPQGSTQTPSVGDIGDGVRDAVVLEVNLEELNGFQNPQRLIEPALGGPDTAERINARLALRLVRLGRNETCESIVANLQENPAGKGKLRVSLQPPTDTSGDCPTVANGGYSGFEHNLYRIEIAQTDTPDLYFKWSQFNGGLVGRGEFYSEAAPSQDHCVIRANRTAIINSGLTEFYLEALQFDLERGHWRVVYGAQANINSNNDIELSGIFGTLPATSGSDTVFFRLWNGLKKVSDFMNSATPVELRDGIRLAFDPPASGNYSPGDYWTFTVRAGEIKNPQTLIDHLPPAGPRYHRVPLAEIDWSARRDTTLSGTIEDCRKRFRPLTNQKLCCTYLVGDGVSSFGDFNSLEEAAAHLPATGGELCLLPGVHFANLKLDGRKNVTVHGCVRRTKVMPHREEATAPIIHVRGGSGFRMHDLDLVASFGEAVLIEASDKAPAKDVRIENCRMLARTYCVRINGAEDIVVARNRLWVLDTKQGMAAISLKATHALIERNRVGVWPFEMKPPTTRGGGQTPDPADPCQTPEFLYDNIHYVLEYASFIWRKAILIPPKQPYNAQGGIHLMGSSTNVRMLENIIDGGAGHGITLGGLLPGESLPSSRSEGADSPEVNLGSPNMWGYIRGRDGKPLSDIDVFLGKGGTSVAQDRSGGEGYFSIGVAQEGQYQLSVSPGWRIEELKKSSSEFGDFYVLVLQAAPVVRPDETAPLDEIVIQENEILRMAMSGIGFRAYAQKADTLIHRVLSGPERVIEYLTGTLMPRELVGVVNIVRDLTIRGNRVHHNLRAVFDNILQKSVHSVGQGGISLGLTESLVIADNLIYENGGSAINPICGIFIGAGDDIQITSNRITGNGTVPDDYETARLEGVRGGIFVRFATAFLMGREGDGIQKPALRIEDNRIDQPAGRAITAFAFGPVACVGNFLNSERAGRWNVLDSLVGAVLILDLGGIQRFLRQKRPIIIMVPPPDYARHIRASATASEGYGRPPIPMESTLPGGEVLFNSNQVRTGPQHRTFISQFLLTLDDAGYDGNQGTVFQPDVLFTNTLLLANTLRSTSNRWREEAVACHFSLLSAALGKAGTFAIGMNTCALNQGDHCIVPMAPPQLLVNENNLEAENALCQAARNKDNFKSYLKEGLYNAWAAQNAGTLNVEKSGVLARTALTHSVRAVEVIRAGYQQAYLEEYARLLGQFGTDNPRVLLANQRATKNATVLRQLQIAGELADFPPQSDPGSGAILDGRVADTAERGQPGLQVELIKQGNEQVGTVATTNASGHYVIILDKQTVAALATEQALRLQVSDAQGKVLQRSETPIQIEAGSTVHHIFTVPVKTVPPAAIADATVIYRAPLVAGGGTPLENIKGIGPKTAAKLRAAGIPDVEAFLRTPGEKLVEIAGFDADVVRKRAEEAAQKAAEETPGTIAQEATPKVAKGFAAKKRETLKKPSTRSKGKKK